MRCYTVLLACGWLMFTPPGSWWSEVTKRVDAANRVIANAPSHSETQAEELLAFSEWLDSHPVPQALEKWELRAGFDTAEACHRYAEKQHKGASELALKMSQRAIESPDEKLRRFGEEFRKFFTKQSLWLWTKCVPSDAIGFKLK